MLWSSLDGRQKGICNIVAHDCRDSSGHIGACNSFSSYFLVCQSHQRWTVTEFNIYHQVSSSNLSFSSVERKTRKEWEDEGNGDGNPVAACVQQCLEWTQNASCCMESKLAGVVSGMEGFVCCHFYFALKKMAVVASRLHTGLAVPSLMPHLFFPFFT